MARPSFKPRLAKRNSEPGQERTERQGGKIAHPSDADASQRFANVGVRSEG